MTYATFTHSTHTSTLTQYCCVIVATVLTNAHCDGASLAVGRYVCVFVVVCIHTHVPTPTSEHTNNFGTRASMAPRVCPSLYICLNINTCVYVYVLCTFARRCVDASRWAV